MYFLLHWLNYLSARFCFTYYMDSCQSFATAQSLKTETKHCRVKPSLICADVLQFLKKANRIELKQLIVQTSNSH